MKRKVYSENFVNSLMTELDILYEMLEEINHTEKEKKSIIKQIKEREKYINFLVNN